MKTNYQLLTNAAIKALEGRRPSLLLHSCCGPCSSYVLEYLLKYFDVTLYYYNPNIQPRAEYEKRLATQRQLIAAMCPGVALVEDGWDGESFVRVSSGLEREPEGGARCTSCFELRLRRSAEKARALGCEHLAATLTVSPHKDPVRINEIGAAAAEEAGVIWLPSDFKKLGGYQRSIELSNSYSLYRQNYCGCLYAAAPHRSETGAE